MKPRYRQQPRHADKMTADYNRTQAFMKIATAPLHTLTAAMVESIARTHRIPVAELQERLGERRQREGVQ
jgi:hypothetical protein